MLRSGTNLAVVAIVCLAGPGIVSASGATLPEEPPLARCALTPREVVERFVDLLYRQRKVREAFETWVVSDYVQHKPSVENGREPVMALLEGIFERNPERIYTIHRIVASDDLVVVHYHTQANPDDPGLAIVDIFRVEDCWIVEHWDVVQTVPAESRNGNGMF